MLYPDMMPAIARKRAAVTHVFGGEDGWDDAEADLHRYDECPCGPRMVQTVGYGQGYHWVVYHTRRLG